MSKQNHSYDITQVSVQKTHDFGTVAAVWQVFWGRSSAYIKCHRSTEVNGAVTTYTHGGSALLCTIPAIIGLHRTQSPGCVTIVAQSALQTASRRAAQLIAEGRADSPSNFRSVFLSSTESQSPSKGRGRQCSEARAFWGGVGRRHAALTHLNSVTLSPVSSLLCPSSAVQWSNNISPGLTLWPLWIICFRKMWNHLLYPT